MRRRQGFSLAELVVMIALLSLLSSTLVGLISLSLGWYRSANDRLTAEQNVRVAMSIITNEFRQASHSLGAPTAVVIPSALTPLTSELQFTEPVANQVLVMPIPLPNPAPTLWNQVSPASFQTVDYALNQTVPPTAIVRTVTDSSGKVVSTSTIVQSTNGAVDLRVLFVQGNAVSVVVTAQEGGYSNATGYHPTVQDTLTCNQVSTLYH